MPILTKHDENLHFDQLGKLVGHTPFIAVSYRYGGSPVQEVLVKCEHYNLTGSSKDRLALYVLERAREQGLLNTGDVIVVAAGANTAIAYAVIGRVLGHRVRVILTSQERLEIRSLLKGFEAQVELCGVDENPLQVAEAMRHYDRVFLPGPLEALYRGEVHEKTTGREIGRSLLLEDIKPAAFAAGTGSGGTLAGVGKYLKTLYPGMDIHPLEAAETRHRIAGWGDRVTIAGGEAPGRVLQVCDGDAILMAQQLAQTLKLPVGFSSGANLLGAIRLRLETACSRPVVTVFPDDNKKYVTTDLFREEPLQPRYLTPAVELLDYRVLNKV